MEMFAAVSLLSSRDLEIPFGLAKIDLFKQILSLVLKCLLVYQEYCRSLYGCNLFVLLKEYQIFPVST